MTKIPTEITSQMSGEDIKLFVSSIEFFASEQAKANELAINQNAQLVEMNKNLSELCKFFRETGDDKFEGKLNSIIKSELKSVYLKISGAILGLSGIIYGIFEIAHRVTK